MKASKFLKRRLVLAFVAMLITFSSMVMVTFAWYIYQKNVHTSDIRMAVGSGNSLQISNTYDGKYGTAAVLDEFEGTLTPVSTDRITGGFQKVKEFIDGKEGQPEKVAGIFSKSSSTDFYKTTLYVRLGGGKQNVYLSDVSFEDSDQRNPISTAIRMGFVVHQQGKDSPVQSEYIFAINTEKNPQAQYNTATGKEGYVLDSSKTDGTTIPMKNLYTSENFCDYDKNTGSVTLSNASKALFSLQGDAQGGYGEPVQVDVYIWLEGCDEDCTNNLCSTMLKNIALSFACKAEQ